MHTIETSLSEFVYYVQTHLTGDEKGEAADFLDHLFRALGHAGIKEAGATREALSSSSPSKQKKEKTRPGQIQTAYDPQSD